MKKLLFLFTLLGTFFTGNANNVSSELASHEIVKSKTEKFKVYGNCGMCKKAIEGSLEKVKGIKEHSWNKETGEMSVTFNDKKITLDEIKQKIAAVGYDTDTFKAKDEIYNSLPGCCQYDRPE